MQATPRQVEYIEILANNLGMNYTRVQRYCKQNDIPFPGRGYENMTKIAASALIHGLKTLLEGEK